MANKNKGWFVKGAVILLCMISHCNWVIKASSLSAVDHHHDDHDDDDHRANTFTVQLSSLLSPATSDSCFSSTPPGQRQGASLEVRHKHGPCSPLNLGDKSTSPMPTHVEILEQDEARVDSIRDRVNPKKVEVDSVRLNKDVALPAKSGSTIGSGNFVVTVGLGTPKKDLSLIFDTGSDFTWTQCEPCSKNCYKQHESMFDPSKSSTYSNITCKSSLCSEVGSATSTSPSCSKSTSTCIYGIQYGDSSFSVGFFAKDILYLGPHDTIPDFLFGCGENNQGLFGGSAGLIGLGRNKLSVASQTASSYGNVFSYCLPSKSSSTGHLTFGKGGTTSKAIKYTSLTSSAAGPSFYFIDLQGMTVGGRKLRLSSTVFSTTGTLIDSGTVISRLPPVAYSALRAAFRGQMSKYPRAPPLSILDTCYNFRNYTTVTLPKISLLFSGGARMELDASGIFYVKDLSQACLAFAGNNDAGDVGILGNIQQLTFDVVYDVAGGRIGFGPGGCA